MHTGGGSSAVLSVERVPESEPRSREVTALTPGRLPGQRLGREACCADGRVSCWLQLGSCLRTWPESFERCVVADGRPR